MPDLSNQANWEERARIAAPHAVNTYILDAFSVHGLILRNIAESSDAYTYVKTNIRRDDGRVDITALIARYEKSAMQDMHINEAKKTLANIAYHNERAMTFEKFVATFQKAIDDLEMYGRGMPNGEIVDLLWTKMGNPELAPYMVSMKFHYQVVRRGDRFDTVGSTVIQWIVLCCRQCTVSSTGDMVNRDSMRADNIQGTWIFPQNADNNHGTWIFTRNADTSMIIFTNRMR